MTGAEVLDQILTYGPQVISVAAVVTALTPTPADDGVLAVVRKIFDFLAFNWGHAKNDGANKSSNSNTLGAILVLFALGMAMHDTAEAAVCGVSTSARACPAGSVCFDIQAPTNRIAVPPATVGAPLLASEIRGYEVSLDGVLVGTPTGTTFDYAIPADKTIPTSSIWSILTVDTDGKKSPSPFSCNLAAAVSGPKSPPAAPSLLSVGVR